MFKTLLILLCCYYGSVTAKFPTEIQKCKYADSACIKKTATDILQNHSDGLPGLNLPALDPLIIDKMDIIHGGDSPINIVLNFKNVKLSGLKNAKITDVKGFNKDKIELTFKAPILSLIGTYKVSGRVLVLPIQGKGDSNMTMANVEVTMKFNTKTVTKNGKEHIEVDKFAMNLTTTRFYIDFSNLFNGDKALGDNMNVFLNDNWQEVLDELRPTIHEAFAQIFSNVINSAISKYPHAATFLE